MLYRKLQAEGLSSLQVCVPSLLTLLFILFHFDLVDLWFKISENLSFQLPVYILKKLKCTSTRLETCEMKVWKIVNFETRWKELCKGGVEHSKNCEVKKKN